MEAGHVLDEPIPRIEFAESGTEHVRRMHEKSLNAVTRSGEWQGWDSWRIFEQGSPCTRGAPHLIAQRASETKFLVSKAELWFCLEAMLAWPVDMFGDLMAENRHGRASGFYPTPHCVVEMMTRMNFAEGVDYRSKTVCDPCVSTGHMILHASNHSYRLYAQDVNATVLKACKVNGYCFAPWMVRPLPFWNDEADPQTKAVLQAKPKALALPEPIPMPSAPPKPAQLELW